MPPKVRFKREQIVTAATDVVRAAGMPALTARALSDKLNCSVAPIFSEFSNMEEVRGAVIAQAKKIYESYIAEGLRHQLPFKGAGLKYIEFAKTEPNLFKVLFMSENRVHIDDFMLLDDNNAKIVGALTSSWSLDINTARELHKNIMLFTHGIAVLCASGSCDFSDDEISERLTFAFTAMLKEIKGDGK